MEKFNTPYTMLDVDILLEAIRNMPKGTCLEKAMLVAALRVIRVNTWGQPVSVIIRRARKTADGYEGVNMMSKTTFVIPHEYDKSENECYVFTSVATLDPTTVRKVIAVVASAELMHAVLGKNLTEDVEFRMVDTTTWTQTDGWKSAEPQGAWFKNGIVDDDPAAAPSVPYAVKHPAEEASAESTPAAETTSTTSTTDTKQSGTTTTTTSTTEEAKKS